MLCLNSVYAQRPDGGLRFTRVKAPEREELEDLVQRIAERVARALERMGLLRRDAESAWLELPPVEHADAMRLLLGSSVTYRIGVGPQAGRKALVLRTIRALPGDEPLDKRVAKANGFSLHAGVSCEAHQRQLRERLCRYDVQGCTSVAGGRMPGATIARPAVAEQRLTLTAQGWWCACSRRRTGTEPRVWCYSGHPALRAFGVSLRLLKIAPGDSVELLDFIVRLAALVPRPRVNLTRYHGVLAPNHRWRAEVTPSGRGRKTGRGTAQPERSAIERHAAMTWARRLKRVFGINVESCARCGKAVRVAAPAHPCARGISASLHVIASIEEPVLIEGILAHVRGKAGSDTAARGPPSTGPPLSA